MKYVWWLLLMALALIDAGMALYMSARAFAVAQTTDGGLWLCTFINAFAILGFYIAWNLRTHARNLLME